jgi:hypothetical protein
MQMEGNQVVTVASVGLNAVFVATAGSAVTYLCGYEIDGGVATAPAVDCTFQLLIVGLVDREDNDVTLINANWLVLNAMSHFNSFGDSESPTTAASRSGLLGV